MSNEAVESFGIWAEDRIRAVRIGSLRFVFTKACVRCVGTMVDQNTGKKGQEPLKTLEAFRRAQDPCAEITFGQNAYLDSRSGQVSCGDAVEIEWR